MRQENIKRLKNEAKILNSELENVEQTIEALNADSEREKDLKHLARLIYAGKVVEKAGLLYSFNSQVLCQFLATNKITLQKPLE